MAKMMRAAQTASRRGASVPLLANVPRIWPAAGPNSFHEPSGEGTKLMSEGKAAISPSRVLAFWSSEAAATRTLSSCIVGALRVATVMHSRSTPDLKEVTADEDAVSPPEGQLLSNEIKDVIVWPDNFSRCVFASSSRSFLSFTNTSTDKSMGKSLADAAVMYFWRPLSDCKIFSKPRSVSSSPSCHAAFRSFNSCSVFHSLPSIVWRSAMTPIFRKSPSCGTSAAAKA
mmetsp:Transcript_78496/g.217970  ORF Transcript_78496/g.217970 Transcript_78496/m.217970 type:complete len:229 (+) Transcript_78496:129-815(+)